MKVTIVHQYYKHPREGGAIRSYYLAKGLIDHGHEVEIITAHNEKTLQIRRIDGAKVFYLPIFYDNTLAKYQRIWAFLKFVIHSIRLLHQLKTPGMLYVISTPLTVGVIALWTKLTQRAKYIFEIGDLWPEAPIQLGYIKNPIVKKVLYWFENMVYNHASKIVAMSPDIEKIINRPDKTIMIPNMADCDFFEMEDKPISIVKEHNLENAFVISYLGTAGRANHLEYLLEAAKAISKVNLNVKFIIAAAGSELEHFRASIIAEQLSNIIFVPYTNKSGVRELLAVSDAVYVSFSNVPILSSGSPNKFFDGLAAGKIIITNFGGWVRDEIENTQCGFSYTPDNTYEFIEKLTPYVNSEVLRLEAQTNARRLAENKFSRNGLIEKWLTLFD